MAEKKLINGLILLNRKNLPITQYFINIKNHEFNNELIDTNKVQNIDIEDIKFKINQKLKEYFYLFLNDYIVYDYRNYSINGIIVQDINKFNNKMFESIGDENKKYLVVDGEGINIYYTPIFNYSFFCKFNKSSNFIFFNNSVFVYPLTFYKIFKLKPNLDLIQSQENKEFNDIFIDIIKNKNKTSVDFSKLDYKTISEYFFISLYLNNDYIYRKIIDKTNKENLKQLVQNYIFYIIKIKNIEILKYLNSKHQQILKDILLNSLNKNGLNVLEYSFLKFKKDNSYYNMVSFLNQFTYSKPNYIFDIILKTNIIHHDLKNDFDNLLVKKIKRFNNFENVEIINTIILNCMYENLNSENNQITIQDIIQFITHNINFINLQILFNLIFKYSSVLVLKDLLFNKVLNFNHEILKLLIELKQTDYILKEYKKEAEQYSSLIIYDLIEDLNIYGLIFLIKYINPKLINIKDKNKNNLMHYLCNQNKLKDKEDYEDLEYNVFKFFVQENENLILKFNDKHETPIFNTIKQKNLYLFKLNIEINPECCENKNNEGFYVIHEIVKNDFKTALYEYISNNLNTEYLDIYGNNGLLLALKNKNQDLSNDLIENGSNLDIQDINGNSIYHFIALYNLKNIKIQQYQNIKNKNNFNVLNCIQNNVYYQFKKFNNL